MDRDYQISIRDVGSEITIIAPHGGRIEPKTSIVARLVAGENYNCYCFEGIKDQDNGCLHITSHNFDEPRAVEMVTRSRIAVSIHACTEKDCVVYLGGLDRVLKHLIAWELWAKNICVSMDHPLFRGMHQGNICNRCSTGKGVQVEISRGVRDDQGKIRKTAEGVRNALALYENVHQRWQI